MKTLLLSFLILPIIFLSSCEKDNNPIQDHTASEILVTKSQTNFDVVLENSPPTQGDPFDLISIMIDNKQLKITVGYSGGCKTHNFEVIWGEVTSDVKVTGINLIIIHHANNDNCEAYITETIIIPLEDIADSFQDFDPVYVGAWSGWNPDEPVEYEGPEYEFSFEESELCILTVTAMEVICGTGLYGNLWFALDDSTSAGIPDFYFRHYLQPVLIDEVLKDFTPKAGKRYTIGAIKSNENPFWDHPVCMAYVGPSIPVKVLCVSEVDQ